MEDTPTRIDPAALVAAVVNGCPEAEAAMCRHYEAPMRRALARYADSPADAEDWLNTSWIVALTKIREGDLLEPASLCGYLCGIARRVALGALRQRWRQDITLAPDELDAHRDQEDVYRAICGGELVELTQRLIQRLSRERDRRVFEGCFFAVGDKGEVAASLELDATQLSRVLYRARQRLWDAAEHAGVASSLRELLSETT
jgi:RNA polymerase sigma factor (sigma-70 family)